MLRKLSSALAGAAMLVAVGVQPASAAPDASGSVQIVEPNGFYTAIKAYEVYTDTNPTNPLPLAGNFTYLYTITNTAGSLVGLIGFNMEVPSGSVTAAGFIPGAGVAPSGTTVNPTSIVWTWASATPINPGQTSEQLFVQSPFGPGTVNDTMVSVDGEFSLDTPSTCVGPDVAPVGEPIACTIGWWKNRSDLKKGTLQFFPDPEFGQVVTAAVALSSGIFIDEADLIFFLTSKGPRSILVRGKQQMAATLLNLAAGDLFPENQKCKLFEENSITTNACGTGITVGDGVNQSKVNILGDDAQTHSAHECFDDINNGIGVVQ